MTGLTKPAIKVELLGKQYRLGETHGASLLRDTLAGWLRQPFRTATPAAAEDERVLWALRDASFEIKAGEAIGIIGHNGSGKSTLLKLLSRITEPTSGRICLRGRVASLLEVGTGFHPDLTGRENVFLNGAILGMTRAETRAKFDEIVAFAGLERFIDTPVRRYSSGMSVRLAFAVAAHLEPEILLLDEVLAVGDADFQRKCLRKMGEVTRQEGRTVLFVSHQLPSVQQLCDRVLVLNRGQITHDTDAAGGIAAYLAEVAQSTPTGATARLGSELELVALDFSPRPAAVFADLNFQLQLRAATDCQVHDLCLIFQNSFGQRAAIADLRKTGSSYTLAAGQTLDLQGTCRRQALVAGSYSVGLYLRTNTHMADHWALQSLEIHPQEGDQLLTYSAEHLGNVALDLKFDATITR